MHGYLHVNSQLIWSSDSTSWSSFSNGGRMVLKETASPSVGGGTIIKENSNSVPAMWLEIDNTPGASGIGADFCLIEFSGKIETITTSGTPVAGSVLRAALVGLPVVGTDIAKLEGFDVHPVTTTTIPYAQLTATMADGLGVLTQAVNSFPPFFGYIPNTEFVVDVTSVGWPFHGQPIAVNDPWHFVFPIGKLGDATGSISGYRKLYFAMRSVNPNIVGGSPSAMTISGKMYAHLYEYRGNVR